MFNLSEYGDTGKIIDKKSVSVEDAGNYLELVADCIARGKPFPFLVASDLVAIIYKAAELAKQGDQKGAISAIAKGVGLQANNKRRGAPFWEIINCVQNLNNSGLKITSSCKEAAEKFGMGQSTVNDYWNEYLEKKSKFAREEPKLNEEVIQILEDKLKRDSLD